MAPPAVPPQAGAGDINLTGVDADVVLTVPVNQVGPYSYTAAGSITVRANHTTTGAGSHITLTAGTDVIIEDTVRTTGAGSDIIITADSG